MREAVLREVNRVRTGGHVCGTQIMPPVAALSWNDILFSAAARHTLDMVARSYFSHTTPEGVDFAQRVSNEGYAWSAVGENLAGGPGSVSAVMQAWMGSEAHCRNVMHPVFAEVAVACVAQPGYTWTMELGRR